MLTSAANVERSGLYVCENAKQNLSMQALIYRQSYGGFFLPLPSSRVVFSPACRLADPAAAC